MQSLVAPIALYPDDLLAQTLVAATYPLEIIQLQQWLVKHPGLKDKELADSVAKQPWDPSIQSMAAVPDVVKRLADDIQWTTDLGNAFLAQQADVMTAVQVMRKKAKDKGALASNEQQKVKVDTVEQKQVIVVESANPEVIYVPVYSPAVVYPPPVYPYPPIYYPPYPPGAAMVTFTVGMMWGAAVWGGACCHAGWGGNNVYINNNNNFNQINHNRNGSGSGNWQHNAEHRGGAPYGDRATANKYGGSSRGRSAGTGSRLAAGSAARAPALGRRLVRARRRCRCAAVDRCGRWRRCRCAAVDWCGRWRRCWRSAVDGCRRRPVEQPRHVAWCVAVHSGFSGGSGGYSGCQRTGQQFARFVEHGFTRRRRHVARWWRGAPAMSAVAMRSQVPSWSGAPGSAPSPRDAATGGARRRCPSDGSPAPRRPPQRSWLLRRSTTWPS